MDFRSVKTDGYNLVLFDHYVHHAAFAYADVLRAFCGNRRDGVQDFQRRAAERTVDRGGCDHVR